MASSRRAAIGSTVFFFLAPGTVAGLMPWLISGWRFAPGWPLWLRLLGGAVVLAGIALLVRCFVLFVTEGRGTPAPVAPTEELVVHGPYRYVRNPMYLAVSAVIAGQSLALPSLPLLVYLAVVAVAVVIFVAGYEQPTLRSRYGAQYEAYCQAVPAWRPRLTPWKG